MIVMFKIIDKKNILKGLESITIKIKKYTYF
jgi:hypothetical protein